MEKLEQRLVLADVAGVINSDTTWDLSGSPYRITADVFVRNNATLTIEPGVEVIDNSFSELHISDNGSGGTLNADGVTFHSDVVFGQNGDGTIQNSTVSSEEISVTNNASPVITGTSFHGGRSVTVFPEYAPNLAGTNNTFGTGARIGIHGGVIDQDTLWPNLSDASTYDLRGDVFVRNGATLTIGTGMELFDSSFVEIYISDDGSDGTLNADGVTFDADVIFGQDATGTIQNSTVAGGGISITENASPVISNTSFHNGRAVTVSPEYVPQLDGRGNTFDTGATIGVHGGVVDRDITWPNLSDASTYEMRGDVFVRSGATLTIASGMELFDSSFVEIYISDDSSGGTLNADGVTFDSDVFFGANSTGLIQNSTIAGKVLTINTGASPNLVGNQMHGGRPVAVFPQYVPRLAGNQFTFGASVGVLAGQISTNTTWPVLPGVTTMELIGDVEVTSDASLTIADGLIVEADSFAEMYVGASGFGGALHADFVVLDTSILFGRDSAGSIANSRFIGRVEIAGQSTVDFDANHFGTANEVSGTVNTSGTIDLTNNFWGTNVLAEIEDKVLHQVDDARRPLILFDPFLASTPAKANPVITWSEPASIMVGTTLSETQLNATADTSGTFVYSPPLGTTLAFGNDQTLSVSFTPSNTLTFNSATAFVEIDVLRSDPVITWVDPEAIPFGTPLSATQLDATADVAGTFQYTPPLGTVLNAGVGQPLAVTFTPTDTANYNTVSAQVVIDVAKADPVITWDPPAPIVFGTQLTDTQLNATSDTPGTFAYLPLPGAILNAGNDRTLSVTFTPDNSDNFNSASASVSLEVLRADPVITWNDPAPIIVGNPLTASELNAVADVPGQFTYTPDLDAILSAGDAQTLSVTFQPTSFLNYNTVTAQVEIDVLENQDFGDAPNSYSVGLQDDGPRHSIGGLRLGGEIDRDDDGQPSDTADGDDADIQGDDDDGLAKVVDSLATAISSTVSSIEVSSSDVAKLDAWIDFDGNGRFDHPAEHLGGGVSIDLVAGTNLISFAVPAGALPGETFIRLRASSGGGLLPTGVSADGEVEDHAFTIVEGSGETTDVAVIHTNSQLAVTASGSDVSIFSGVNEIFRAPTNQLRSITLNGTMLDDVVSVTLGENDSPGLQIDADDGEDVLQLAGAGGRLDFTDAANAISSIETIDLTSDDANTVVMDATSVDRLSVQKRVRLDGASGDQLILADAASWVMSDPIVTENQFLRTVVQGDSTLIVDLPFAYQNLAQRHDVSNDGQVTVGDALRVINELQARRVSRRDTTRVVDPRTVSVFDEIYFDTTGDDNITALDALRVINELAKSSSSEDAEAEWATGVSAITEGDDNTSERNARLTSASLESKDLASKIAIDGPPVMSAESPASDRLGTVKGLLEASVAAIDELMDKGLMNNGDFFEGLAASQL